MTFMRSKSGIANFSKFVGADIIVYIEGKINEKNTASVTYDEHFYNSLLGAIFPSKIVKVKCVGCKKAAIDYALSIDLGTTKANVVVVDRDAEDVTRTLLNFQSIIYTYGYSWENDFWSNALSGKTLSQLTLNESDTTTFIQRAQDLTDKLKYISALDIVCHIVGEALLPKNGGACGINFSLSSPNPLPKTEVDRIKLKYKSLQAFRCAVCKKYLAIAKSFSPEKIIQGHLWEHVMLRLIVTLAKGQIANSFVKNIAMENFRKNPPGFMSPQAYSYYQSEFTARFS